LAGSLIGRHYGFDFGMVNRAIVGALRVMSFGDYLAAYSYYNAAAHWLRRLLAKRNCPL
jgi:hypothetical protein